MRFEPNFQTIAHITIQPSIAELADETGMYSATPEFLREHGGPIANRFLDAVPESYFAECRDLGLFPSADVRIHRLYPGDYPAYPGWHCDGEYRETYFSQPDLLKIPVSRHVVGHVSTVAPGISRTEFLTTPVEIDLDEFPDMRSEQNQRNLWHKVHAHVESTEYASFQSLDGELIMMDARTVHRCKPCTVRGWRLFFRMSMWHRPNLDGGKLSKQEQVYQVIEGHGW